MTYLELFDGEWDEIKYNLKKADRIKLKEICDYSSKLIEEDLPGCGKKNYRQLIREWCISKDIDQRDQKIDLLLRLISK